MNCDADVTEDSLQYMDLKTLYRHALSQHRKITNLREALDRADGYIHDLQLRCYSTKKHDNDFRKDIQKTLEATK